MLMMLTVFLSFCHFAGPVHAVDSIVAKTPAEAGMQ